MIEFGEYPNIWKIEFVTPVPKEYPPPTPEKLRKIAVTKNFSKIVEHIIAEFMLLDMKDSRDPSQYGNEKGLSVQHYLVNMLNKILTALDKNSEKEAYAVIANLIDWNQAFDRQCPKLIIESFIENGVRPSLIPVLVNYFQDRKMFVKWHGILSTERKLPGGGPQESTGGLISYMSQSTTSANFVPPDHRYKFVDDLTILEIINLVSVGISAYNFKTHVASDIGIDQYFISPQNLESNQYLKKISEWTDSKRMKLNGEKSSLMIFNETKNYQVTTRLELENSFLNILEDTKLLGVVISADLTWRKNTKRIVQKSYQRIIILKKLFEFNVPEVDLLNIYILFIRSMLEQSCVVWHSSITQEEETDLERVQKVCLKIILKEKYETYEKALERTKLEKLVDRRTKLCLKFAKKCTENEDTKSMFPINPSLHSMETRKHEKYYVQKSKTERLAKSANLIYKDC